MKASDNTTLYREYEQQIRSCGSYVERLNKVFKRYSNLFTADEIAEFDRDMRLLSNSLLIQIKIIYDGQRCDDSDFRLVILRVQFEVSKWVNAIRRAHERFIRRECSRLNRQLGPITFT